MVYDRMIQSASHGESGVSFVIEVLENGIPQAGIPGAVEKTYAVYEKRIDEIRVDNTRISREGKRKILIQLPNLDAVETDRIRKILLSPSGLEFKVKVYGPIRNKKVASNSETEFLNR